MDVYCGFATVAEQNNYCRPSFHTDSQDIDVVNGRHPVVEKVMTAGSYIPNDVKMDSATNIFLITGPNMSGKKNYLYAADGINCNYGPSWFFCSR